MATKDEKIYLLIKAALTRYSHEELFSGFLDTLNDWHDIRAIAQIIAKDNDLMDDIKSEIAGQYISIPTKGMNFIQENKIKDFLTSEIFPNYNEQQFYLNF